MQMFLLKQLISSLKIIIHEIRQSKNKQKPENNVYLKWFYFSVYKARLLYILQV